MGRLTAEEWCLLGIGTSRGTGVGPLHKASLSSRKAVTCSRVDGPLTVEDGINESGCPVYNARFLSFWPSRFKTHHAHRSDDFL